MKCSSQRYSDMKESEDKLNKITKDSWYVKPLAFILRMLLGSDKPSGVR